MEEKREPLSEMAIERKIQILRNKHMDSEVIALVKSDYEYGLTDDEIGLYLNKSYDIEQMKVLSKCLHKGVSEELLTLLKDSRMAAPKMQTALDYYEKGVPIDAIREVVQKVSCMEWSWTAYQEGLQNSFTRMPISVLRDLKTPHIRITFLMLLWEMCHLEIIRYSIQSTTSITSVFTIIFWQKHSIRQDRAAWLQ